jgi:hypothetical protein
MGLLAIILVGWVCFSFVMGIKVNPLRWADLNEKTLVFLIPEGTKGWCYLIWDDPNAPLLAEKDDKLLVHLNNQGVAHTSSSPEKKGYLLEYYHVDKNGKRTKITGIPTKESGEEYSETSIFVTLDGSQGIDEGPDGPFYPSVNDFFLGTPVEIKEELARIERGEGGFPYPEDALRLKRDKK